MSRPRLQLQLCSISHAMRFMAGQSSRRLTTFLPLALGATLFPATLAQTAARAQTYSVNTLAAFDGANGQLPYGIAIDGSGNLFGVTYEDGAHNDGTVFEVAAGSDSITTLANFSGANGKNPQAGVTLDSKGDIFGTTYAGGANGDGTVFEIAAGSGTLTTLASFNGMDGENPYATLTLDSSGNIYGTTESGTGDSTGGTVFKIVAGTNTLTTVAAFNSTNGLAPEGGVTLDSKGDLFGTTGRGLDANNEFGTVYEIAAGSNTIDTLASFDSTGANGAEPTGNLVLDARGNIYGTTMGGGPGGHGTVFEISNGGGAATTLVSFNGANGVNPQDGLVIDSSGNLYGTTVLGGDLSVDGGLGFGTVFEIAAGTSGLTTLATFNGSDGGAPDGLILDSSGNIYGTAGGDGTGGYGTVFGLSPTGSASAPEPGTLALLLPLSLTAAFGVARRRKRAPRASPPAQF